MYNHFLLNFNMKLLFNPLLLISNYSKNLVFILEPCFDLDRFSILGYIGLDFRRVM